MNITQALSQKFGIKESYAQNIINLIDEGCTIPFIARYRKEMHGAQDDQTLRDFADSLSQLRNLEKRKEEVLKLLVQGRSNTEIAKELIVSVHTAKAHVCSILQKLCVDDRVQAAVKAIKEGLV